MCHCFESALHNGSIVLRATLTIVAIDGRLGNTVALSHYLDLALKHWLHKGGGGAGMSQCGCILNAADACGRKETLSCPCIVPQYAPVISSVVDIMHSGDTPISLHVKPIVAFATCACECNQQPEQTQ